MLYLIKSYLNFLWLSKNQHGVHSPFVFDLVTKCFYNTGNYTEYKTLKEYRKKLLQYRQFIEVTDFGAGSRIFKSNNRQVSKIAQTAGVTVKRAELLFRIVRYFKPENILEIGTSLGLATSALSLGNQKSKITTLEGCPKTAQQAQEQFKEFQLTTIQSVVSEFNEYLKKNLITNTHYQLIYFDGNHSKEATLNYFELLLPTITNETVWIFDDIHWSLEMEKAWEKIRNHPKVTVTIDTFQWGLVFFRKEQEKEHFIIRT